jgi:hypothetical protein
MFGIHWDLSIQVFVQLSLKHDCFAGDGQRLFLGLSRIPGVTLRFHLRHSVPFDWATLGRDAEGLVVSWKHNSAGVSEGRALLDTPGVRLAELCCRRRANPALGMTQATASTANRTRFVGGWVMLCFWICNNTWGASTGRGHSLKGGNGCSNGSRELVWERETSCSWT